MIARPARSLAAQRLGEDFTVKRIFMLGTAKGRKLVSIDVRGPRVILVQKNPDGGTRRNERELRDEIEARSVCEGMIRELLSRGFVEQAVSGGAKTSQRETAAASRPAERVAEPEKLGLEALYDLDESPVRADGPALNRLAAAPVAKTGGDGTPKKKKKGGKKKKRKKAESGDSLDKRVLAAVGAVGMALAAFLGYMVYDAFLAPSTIVGTWAGSMIDFEIGRPIIHNQYRLVLDDKKRASLTLQEKFTSVGTYTVKGDRLVLSLKEEKDAKEKDEEGAPDEPFERQYKFALGRATLDLFEPASGKKTVQLLRFREPPVVGGGGKAPPPAADLAGDVGKGDEAEDARLASVEFSPKDNAFKLRHPPGCTPDTGSRPDNTYSWGSFTKGSAKIQVFAEIQGSLLSGSDSAQPHEEGSELAPVHRAHELYKKTASEEYSDYNEGKPSLFKGARLGEGRIAAFTASAGGLFGSKLRGYRVTLLTNDRRVSILCHCPEADFKKLSPTFLAVCRSLSR